MSEADIQLLLTALGGVALLVALIVTRIRLHPLIALLVVSLAVGIVAGMDIGSIAGATVAGAGHTLGVVEIVIALGAMLGKILANSGVTEAIADSILSRSSDKRLPWAMAFAAFVVGIPMFFEVGLVVLLPLIFSVARKLESKGTFKGSPYVLIGVPVIAALASLHGMVPPHPGPLTAIATLKTSVGPTMVYGFIAAIPAVILAGPIYARLIAPGMSVRPDQALLDQFTASGAQISPGAATVATTNAPIRDWCPRRADAGNPDVGQYSRRDAPSQEVLGRQAHRVSGRSTGCHARRRPVRLDYFGLPARRQYRKAA